MNDGPNVTGRKSVLAEHNYNTYIQLGEVISTNDPNGLGRIKARIKGARSKGGDDGISDGELPWSFPLMTKLISITPKVGEAVFLFCFNVDKQHSDRMYLGPIISQEQQLDKDPYYMSALAGFTFGSQKPNTIISSIPELNGIFPDKSDVSIQGRYNTDITQKRNEIIIRAGKFVEKTPDKTNPYPFKFNTKTQGYIQIKNNVKLSDKKDDSGSVTNIVSNKINLLTHKDGSPFFNLNNQEELINDEELQSILKTAHQLPFGDILLEYLRLMKDALLYHVHNGNSATDLTGSENKQAVAEFKRKANELENAMLSRNIRIN